VLFSHIITFPFDSREIGIGRGLGIGSVTGGGRLLTRKLKFGALFSVLHLWVRHVGLVSSGQHFQTEMLFQAQQNIAKLPYFIKDMNPMNV